MTYCKDYCEEKGISTSKLTEAQRTLYYIAENMKMEKSISEEGYRHFQMAIKALEQDWIPVSERLPSRDEHIKNNGLFIVSDGNRSYSEWFDAYDKQKFGEPTMCGFRVDYCVIAWKNLPEPYKGVSE